ncbi:MAPEG family protein [soil metagenome]
MRLEYAVLVWGCILAFVHIFAAAQVKTQQYGTQWNAGARDETLPPPTPLVGRLSRAQANFFETFPIVVAAVALLGVTDIHTRWTAIGAVVWLVARIVYIPLYAFGVRYVRTLAFLVSVAGIAMILWPVLRATLG